MINWIKCIFVLVVITIVIGLAQSQTISPTSPAMWSGAAVAITGTIPYSVLPSGVITDYNTIAFTNVNQIVSLSNITAVGGSVGAFPVAGQGGFLVGYLLSGYGGIGNYFTNSTNSGMVILAGSTITNKNLTVNQLIGSDANNGEVTVTVGNGLLLTGGNLTATGGGTFNPGSFSSGLSGTNITGTQTNVVYLTSTNGITWSFTNSSVTIFIGATGQTNIYTNSITNIVIQTPSNVMSIWQITGGGSMTNNYTTNAAGGAMWGLGTDKQQNSSDTFSLLGNGTISGVRCTGAGTMNNGTGVFTSGSLTAGSSASVITKYGSFITYANGLMTASNAVFTNLWVSNGITSTARNGLAPISISPGASPFSYTSTATNNITVFISGGIVTAISINGTSIASGLTLTSVTPIVLQTNETLTVTYSSAPTMFYKPF